MQPRMPRCLPSTWHKLHMQAGAPWGVALLAPYRMLPDAVRYSFAPKSIESSGCRTMTGLAISARLVAASAHTRQGGRSKGADWVGGCGHGRKEQGRASAGARFGTGRAAHRFCRGWFDKGGLKYVQQPKSCIGGKHLQHAFAGTMRGKYGAEGRGWVLTALDAVHSSSHQAHQPWV